MQCTCNIAAPALCCESCLPDQSNVISVMKYVAQVTPDGGGDAAAHGGVERESND